MKMRYSSRQKGQALVVMAGIIIALTFLGVLVFDVGLGMSARRNLQADSDAAALAGARSFSLGTNQANYTAMQYLTGPLSFSLPLSPCTSATACPAGTYTTGIYTITLTDSTTTTYPNVLDVVLQMQQPGIFSRLFGVSQITIAASGRSAPTGPSLIGAAYALAAISGDAGVNGGGNGTQTVTGPAYAFGNLGANNGPHSMGIPKVQTNYNGAPCGGNPTNEADFGGGTSNGLSWHWEPVGGGNGTIGLNKPAPTPFDTAGPTIAGPTYTTTASAKSGGHWMPGIYSGIVPSGGTMNPGVYKIIGVSNPSLGSITNTTYTASGTQDTNGAVAIVLDNTDTGTLDISGAILNGLDDVNTPPPSPRDPQGTHNFVIYGGNGPTGFAGTIDIGPHATTDLSGIVYLPKVAYSDHGNTTVKFTGSATFASMTSSGTANITFSWVCGLNAVSATGGGGGLIR
ncbi:MAG TPA: Tad domain-containing protein [Candidatus Limnocylindrales bacterium]|nr:Tad domain-containing protein [Candidatus Limnocylindrales bacterium]